MTDDLEPRLRDHLRQRASRVSAPPDVADVHQRIDARHRRRRARARRRPRHRAGRRSRGRLGGWRSSTEPDRDTVAVGGRRQRRDSGDDAPAAAQG